MSMDATGAILVHELFIEMPTVLFAVWRYNILVTPCLGCFLTFYDMQWSVMNNLVVRRPKRRTNKQAKRDDQPKSFGCPG